MREVELPIETELVNEFDLAYELSDLANESELTNESDRPANESELVNERELTIYISRLNFKNKI